MSKVYKIITKPRLLFFVPRDYLILMTVIAGVVFCLIWVLLFIPKVISGVVVWFSFVGLLGLGVLFGAVKAKYDPEFLSVHFAKLQVPAKDKPKQVERYLKKIEIEP